VIPLKDLNPTVRVPVVTALLIVANVAVYVLLQVPSHSTPAGDVAFTYQYAAIPCEVTSGEPLTVGEIEGGHCDRSGRHDREEEPFPGKHVWLAVLASMFLHAGILHLAGNMLFLWIFGNNVEDRIGPLRYLAFYVAGGVAASALFFAVSPNSTTPVIGASGAIAAVMGAYLVWYPRARIRTLVLLGFIPLLFSLSARVWLVIWFVLQFFTDRSSGVAWVAHVGGFAFGAALALRSRDRVRP
jgi:membrane associated rhomboid family serine protease